METKIRESLKRKYLAALNTVFDLQQAGINIARGEFVTKNKLNTNFWSGLRHSGLASSTNILIDKPTQKHVILLIEWFRQYHIYTTQGDKKVKPINKIAHIPVKIDQQHLVRLKKIASMEKRTVNNLIESLIKDYIKKN